jgi:putative transposase
VESLGPICAAEIRRNRAVRIRTFTHWKWHLYEMYEGLPMRCDPVAALGHEGEVLEFFATKSRDKAAALNAIA